MNPEKGSVVFMESPESAIPTLPCGFLEKSKVEVALQVFHRLSITSEIHMNETDKAMYQLACKVIREHLE